MGFVFCSTGVLEERQKRKREQEEAAEFAKLEAEKKIVNSKVTTISKCYVSHGKWDK